MILTKCIVVGESGVGKSSISNFYTAGVLADGVDNPTIGIEFYSKHVKTNDRHLKLQIWDTAGQERFASIVIPYFRDACGVLICFSIIKRDTFEKLGKHIDGIKKYCPKHACIVLVGTYSDMCSKREVSYEEASVLAKKLEIPYFEVSAMTGAGVNQCFDKLVSDISHAYDEGLLGYETLMDAFELEPNTPKKSCCGML